MLTSRRIIFGILLCASILSMASTDLYVPSLPDLPGFFATGENMVQLTVTLNVLAFALGQFVYGPMADRYGRRRVLMVAMVLFGLSSLACACSQTIEQLLAARIFQGLAAAAEGVVVLAVIRDLFDEGDRVRAMALFGVLWALAPAVAPVVGGYIHVWLGWQANFFILAAASVLVVALIKMFLRETATRDLRAMQPARVYQAYRSLLTNPRFMAYSLMSGCCLGVIFAFVTAAPFILVNRYGVAIEHYAFYQGTQVLAFCLGSLVASKLARRMDADRLMKFSLVLASVGATALLLVSRSAWLDPVSLNAIVAIIFFASGPIFAAAPAKALDMTDGGGGVAAAALGGLEMFAGGAGSALVLLLDDGSAFPMALTMAVMVAAIWVFRSVSQQRSPQAA